MTNYEKYKEEIDDCYKSVNLSEFIEDHAEEIKSGFYLMDEEVRSFYFAVWLNMEYKEPEINWDEVPVDTPVLCGYAEGKYYEKRHFAKYENGKIYTWTNGQTSFSSMGEMMSWKYVKLAKENDNDN